MINGEGAMENLSSGAASPPGHDPLDDDDLLPWEGQKSDDEAEEEKSPDFSSCGELEFERYCSANSALGTPSSVCNSSVYEFADSEFGSFKSFKLGGENKNLTNFAVDRKLLPFSEINSTSSARSELGDGKRRIDDQELEGLSGTSKGMDFYGSPDAFLNYSGVGLVEKDNLCWGDNNAVGTMENGNSCKNESIEENMNVHDSEGVLLSLENKEGSDVVKCVNEEELSSHHSHTVGELTDGCLERLDLQCKMECDGGDVQRCSDECETSSSDGHSKDDDSMSGDVSDDGRKTNLNCVINMEHLRGERLAQNENGLFMTSAVAFGQDDWDDFMLETRESPLNMMVQDEFLGEKLESTEDEISCNDSSAITTGRSGISSESSLMGRKIFPELAVKFKELVN